MPVDVRRGFRRAALLTTAATYFLIFVGGLVRVSGAGLGCPDWPKCFGRWIPPTSLDQLPAGIDPATFNLTLAWIEYFNRLVGVAVGFLIATIAIVTLRHFRSHPRILYPSLGAAVLVAIQGWQGSQVVTSELEPFIVTIHMVLALVIVSLLIYATLESYAAGESAAASPTEFPQYTRGLVLGLWLLTLVQVILGSQVRQGLESAAAAHPDWTGSQWFGEVGVINDIHLIAGILVAAVTVFTGLTVLKSPGGRTGIISLTVWSLIALVVLQVGSGLILLVSGLPALTDLFHLWFAALFTGLLLVLLSAVRRPRVFDTRLSGGYKRFLWLVAVVVVVMGLGAWWVVEQAERSRSEREPSASIEQVRSPLSDIGEGAGSL